MTSTNLNSGCGAETEKAVTIVSRTKDLENDLATLHDMISLLETKLSLVVRPQVAEDPHQPSIETNGSPIRNSLLDFDKSVQLAYERLSGLRERLDF